LSSVTAYSNSLSEPIIGDTVALVLNRVLKENEALEQVPAYLFDIVLHDGTRVGQIDIRMGETEPLILYGGQIGYGIDKPYRGNGYAAEACILVKQIAIGLNFSSLWITCNPDNIASIKTCEKIGAQFIELVDVPRGTELWHRGDREKLRFYWQLT
jgi:tagatose 1,6-diphosphate aldolase